MKFDDQKTHHHIFRLILVWMVTICFCILAAQMCGYIYMYIFCYLKAKYEIVAIKKSLPKIYNSWFQWILVIYFHVPPLCRWNMTRRYNLLYIFFSRNQALKQTSRNQALKHQQNKYFINFKCAESHTHTIARPYSHTKLPFITDKSIECRKSQLSAYSLHWMF